MTELPISQLPIVSSDENTDAEISELFDEIQREMQLPFIPNMFGVAANSSIVLRGVWESMRNIYLHSTLPNSLTAMILFSISEDNNCEYCGSIHKVTCKTLGIDENTLMALTGDFERLNPRRVQEIVKFAVLCANEPTHLTEEDYDRVRAQGVTDEELVEIIGIAALGRFLDTLADGMKITVDAPIAQALQG